MNVPENQHVRAGQDGRRLFTEAEVAQRYRVSVHTVRRWRREGLIGHLKIKRQRLYRESDLDAFERNIHVEPVAVSLTPRAHGKVKAAS